MYTLKEQEGYKLLQIDGKDMNCPFQQVIPMQNQFGGQLIFHKGCGTWCPLFKIDTLGVVEIRCGSETVLCDVRKPKE